MNRLILIISLALSCNILSSQSFTIEVSSDSILIGNYIEVSFRIENLEGKFEAPSFEGFTILSGPNLSSSMQFINGAASSSKTYSYYIQPKEIGLYTITPAYLDTEGSTLETDPTEINVYPNPNKIIEEPNKKSGHSIFDFDDFPFFNREFNQDRIQEKVLPKKQAKPKRKYKRI